MRPAFFAKGFVFARGPGFARGLALAAALLVAAPAFAQEADEPPHQSWSFSGPFGTFDRASAQRGLQVYLQVCSACHSMKYMTYRELDGLGLTDDQVKAIAASVSVPGGVNDQGEPFERPGLPSDHFRAPFANDNAARAANGGALPPDQSLLLSARDDGANYIDALLNGYVDPPAGVKMGNGMYYNKYFPGHQIAMPPPLHDDAVTYADGVKATVPQMAHDVTTFLAYTAQPEMEERKRTGIKIMIFLAFMTCLTYSVKRKIWANVH
jgi:ubiquinol-cytochrome c reductase cytochrome c1 subunit